MTVIALPALLAISAPAAVVLPAEAVSLDDALRVFRQLCVDPLPSPEAFVAAMNGSGLRWQKVEKTPEEIFGLGNSWRSTVGQITYHNPPYRRIAGGGPACHLEWHPGGSYDHARVAATLAQALALPPGKNSGKKREPQTRWETVRPDGMTIRLFLTSVPQREGGWVARFSISRRERG